MIFNWKKFNEDLSICCVIMIGVKLILIIIVVYIYIKYSIKLQRFKIW